ncbi:P-loop NTPase fold protein [Pedobacter sp. D749]|uniref:P-loop NTPase fold protein n=1 Tax=Pedobacter sp. D749 TaxID=2856523 RepID=UPI001C571BA9|nr:P-loop NTPase fold protein [Pedobacter sp. D749]QXU42962.1 KAP family NTPase [Pedobacter sp. D749]
MTKINNPKFLTNAPIGEDLFKNKSQDKIAQIISEKVINESDFKIIGIDGEWGSGKSNLVKLIQSKLTDTHVFFIYDVWGHQEDEQRKAILVELTEFIKNEDSLLKKHTKDWDSKLKQLLANSKETTTINQPYLSIGFIFSLLSIVYIPTVNVFKDSIKDFFKIESLFWKLVLVAFPILIVIGIYIYNVIGNWFTKKGFWKSFKISAEETFQVYTNKQKEETKIETISENQPSVRDFQKWMKEIDSDLDKKVVIVFDNFDRLPKKHILNIWSSIHIFFAEKKYDNIKVIVPFDREHVQNAFKELNSTDKTFGDDYVNKTFDIVFRVTLPIMSDWKQFFENQWKKAFTQFEEDEMKLVIQVYEFLNRRITPREIISFINEILTIKLLDEKFKERYISIFVLRKDEILKDPLIAITNLDYLMGLKSFYQNDSEFAKQLTAIIYHIEIDNALELIYTQELRDVLNKNDVEQFNIICKSEFIDSIFNSAISSIELFENPIKTLSHLEKETNLSQLHIDRAWNLFYYKILNSKRHIDKLEVEDWQVVLINNHQDNKYLFELLKGYSDILDETNSVEYVSLIDQLFKEISQEKVSPLILEKNIASKSFVEFIENKGDNYQPYKLVTNGQTLDEYLSKLTIDVILKLKNTRVLTKNYVLPKYKVFLKTSLNTYISQNSVELANDVMLKIKETIKNKQDLKDTLDDANIYTLYTNNLSSELPIIDELIAMRIARANLFEPSYQSYFQDTLNNENDDRSKKIARTILNYISYDNILLKAKYFKSSPLFRQTILRMFTMSDLGRTADITSLIEKYQELKTSLAIVDDNLLKEFNKWDIDKSKFDIDKLDNEFIDDCYQYDELNISKLFLEKFNEDFKDLEEADYEVVFGDGSDVHFRYFEKLNLDSLTQTSLDVFEKQLIAKIKEGSVGDPWWKILEVYDSNNHTISVVNCLKNIRDQFLNSNMELDVQTAKEILPYFLKHGLLNPNTEVFRTIIKNSFLSDDGFVNILLNHIDYIKSLYQNSGQSEKESFRNIVNEKRDASELLESMAKSIGIRKSKEKSEDQ